MVTRIQGFNTRMAAPHRISSRLTIRAIKEEVEERGPLPAHQLLTRDPLSDASHQIDAFLPDLEIAKLLNIKPSEACPSITRRTVSGAHVASVARLVYSGTRYSFTGQF